MNNPSNQKEGKPVVVHISDKARAQSDANTPDVDLNSAPQELPLEALQSTESTEPAPLPLDALEPTDPPAPDLEGAKSAEPAPEPFLLDDDLTSMLQEKILELEEYNRRLTADFQNAKRQSEGERTLAVQHASDTILMDWLEVLDNMDRAMESAGDDPSNWLEGIKGIHGQMHMILQRHHIQPIEALHQPFDPQLHEAVSLINDPNLAPDTVAQVVQKGYLRGERLLRPARVIVTQDGSAE